MGRLLVALQQQVSVFSGGTTLAGTPGVEAGTKDESLRAFQSNGIGALFWTFQLHPINPGSMKVEVSCGDEDSLKDLLGPSRSGDPKSNLSRQEVQKKGKRKKSERRK